MWYGIRPRTNAFMSLLTYSRYVFDKRRALPLHLILEVTSACNARCVMCFNWQKTDYAREKRLSLAELDRISATMGDLLWFSLTGGEPFLREDLDQVVRIFQRNHPQFLTIPTNGLNPRRIEDLTRKMLAFHRNSLVIAVSLDGVGARHDKIRGVKGNFEKCLETFRRLKALQSQHKNLHLGVNTTVTNLNQDQIEEIAGFVKKNLPVESHTFELVRGCTRDARVTSPGLDAYARYKEVFKRIMRSYSYYKLNPLSRFLRAAKLYYHDLSYEIMARRIQVIPCYGGKLSAVVDVRGTVYPCELYKPLGALKNFNFDFRKLWFSQPAEAVRREIQDGACHCAHSCFQFVNVLFNPRLYPRLLSYL
jgi:MoaA/NifB/PqqE/SkfB family radical SAM enzyme